MARPLLVPTLNTSTARLRWLTISASYGTAPVTPLRLMPENKYGVLTSQNDFRA
jgi:hypothetical protein